MEVDISGMEKISQASILETVNPYLTGKYLGFIPKDNIIFISKKKMEASLFSRFKNILQVDISKEFPEKLKIKITERRTGLVICSGEECFVVDEAGVAYAAANFDTNEMGEKDAVILRDMSGKKIILGSNIIDPSYIVYIRESWEKIKNDAGVELENECQTPLLASGDIRFRTKDGWMIYFDRSVSAQKEAEVLRLLLRERISEGERKKLDYIDLRTDNKAYYKMR